MAAIIVKKKTVTYASVWLMSEKLETAMKYFIEEFIWLTFFFLKIGHILFQLCQQTFAFDLRDLFYWLIVCFFSTEP